MDTSVEEYGGVVAVHGAACEEPFREVEHLAGGGRGIITWDQ